MSELSTLRKVTLETALPANRAFVEKAFADSDHRIKNFESDAKELASAYAVEGGVQLVDSRRMTPIVQEALVRGWALEFGALKTAEPGQLPAYSTRSRKKVNVSEVAPNGRSIITRYANSESPAYGSWAEIATDAIEVELFNPLFPTESARNEAEANEEAAYAMTKNIHTRVKTVLDAGIGSLGADVWTYKDADVVGLPTTNALASNTESTTALKIEKALKAAIKYFTPQGKANNGEVITLHISVLDEEDLWSLAPLVQSAPYTPAQDEIYRTGNLLRAYGHTFRIVPENWGITSGYIYAQVAAPCFDLFKMNMGEFGGIYRVEPRHPRRRAFVATQMVSIMQPAPYKSNYCRIQYK